MNRLSVLYVRPYFWCARTSVRDGLLDEEGFGAVAIRTSSDGQHDDVGHEWPQFVPGQRQGGCERAAGVGETFRSGLGPPS